MSDLENKSPETGEGAPGATPQDTTPQEGAPYEAPGEGAASQETPAMMEGAAAAGPMAEPTAPAPMEAVADSVEPPAPAMPEGAAAVESIAEPPAPAPEGAGFVPPEAPAPAMPEDAAVVEPMAEPPAPAPEGTGFVPPEAQEPLYPEEIFSHSAEGPGPEGPTPQPAPQPSIGPSVTGPGETGPVPVPPVTEPLPPVPPAPYPYQAPPPAYGAAPQQPGWSNQPSTWPNQSVGWPGQPTGWPGQPTGWPNQPAGWQAPPANWAGYPPAYYPPAGGQGAYGAYPGAYGAYPPAGQTQPSAQPQPGQAAPGQAQPTGQPYPAYYGAPTPKAPTKKKKPLALKVFLWIVSILTAGALLGFAIYVGVDTSVRAGKPDFGGYLEQEPAPPDEGPKDTPSRPESPPDASAPEEEASRPQVDVTPNTEGIQLHPKPEGDMMEPEEVYSQLVKSTVAVSATLTRDGNTAESHGTGIIATSDGYMITNSHVVLNSKSAVVTVATYDGQEYEAVVVGVDRTTDLAVIKTNDHGFIPAEFGDAEELTMGEWVLALGNPGGARFSNSLTRGIVSGLDREVGQYSANGMTYIQTDAAINPGNSGGPLVNLYGQVVGINSSKIVTENYEGMGFAIPVSKAQPIINELLSGGYIKGRTRLGIMCMEIEPAGLMITEFNEDSAFKGTDAQIGDIITALDGEAVTSLSDVSNLLLKYAPGDQVEVTLQRPAEGVTDYLPIPSGGEAVNSYMELKVTVTLLEDKGETQN